MNVTRERRRGRVHVFIVAACTTVFAIAPALPALAQPSALIRAELERKEAQLDDLSARVEIAVDEYHEANDALADVERRMETTADEIERLRAEHAQLREASRVHARRMHVLGPTMELSSVLVASDPTAAGMRAATMRRILTTQHGDLEQLAATREALVAGEARLDDLHRQARERADEVAARRQEIERTLDEVGDQVLALRGELDAAVSAEQAARRQREQAAAQAAAEQARIDREASTPASASPAASAPRAGANAAVDAALSRIGMPYRWGATGPDSFDCSGLMVWAWRQAGVELGYRSSAAQFANLPEVSRSDLRPGDLVYAGSPRVHHVGMYIGNGQIVHAPQSGRPVEIRSMERRDLRGFRRPR